MSILGITGSLTASHVCEEDAPHEHTWLVEAWFRTPVRVDARVYRAMLDGLLAHWSGKVLPPSVEYGEDLAATIGKLVNCIEVTVRRPDERINARWIA